MKGEEEKPGEPPTQPSCLPPGLQAIPRRIRSIHRNLQPTEICEDGCVLRMVVFYLTPCAPLVHVFCSACITQSGNNNENVICYGSSFQGPRSKSLSFSCYRFVRSIKKKITFYKLKYWNSVGWAWRWIATGNPTGNISNATRHEKKWDVCTPRLAECIAVVSPPGKVAAHLMEVFFWACWEPPLVVVTLVSASALDLAEPFCIRMRSVR